MTAKVCATHLRLISRGDDPRSSLRTTGRPFPEIFRKTSPGLPGLGGDEPDDAERGERHGGAERLVVPVLGLGLDRAHVADVRAAVDLGVRVERLDPGAAAGQADAVALARDRRQVADAD